TFDGQPFQTLGIANDLGTWLASGVDDNARHHFAVSTCNGCHSFAETGTSFLQINTRLAGQEATLSGFLTGITVNDPKTKQPRTFAELDRRNADLKSAVCPAPGFAAPRASLREGISRVH